MRTPEEFMDLVLTFARENEHIRMVGMEGSRVNKNIPVDSFQDFDITYFVDDIGAFTENDGWLSFSGISYDAEAGGYGAFSGRGGRLFLSDSV